MKRKIKYTSGPMGKLRKMDDFLAAPENLLFKGKPYAKRQNESSNERAK